MTSAAPSLHYNYCEVIEDTFTDALKESPSTLSVWTTMSLTKIGTSSEKLQRTFFSLESRWSLDGYTVGCIRNTLNHLKRFCCKI